MKKAEAEKLERLEELKRWLASVGLATTTAAALEKVRVKGKDDLRRLGEAQFEELMAAMEEVNFDLLLEKVRGLGHEGAPASAAKLREAVAAREALQQRQADLSRLDQARVAEELSQWLASVGLTAVAAALEEVGVKGKDDLKRLDERAFEVLLAEMEEADFDLLFEEVKGLGHDSAPSSAKELREAVAARKALVAKKRQVSFPHMPQLERSRCNRAHASLTFCQSN
jgi:hypothetical protein